MPGRPDRQVDGTVGGCEAQGEAGGLAPARVLAFFHLDAR